MIDACMIDDLGMPLLGGLLFVAALSYVFFLTQIVIHACSHYAFTGSKALDTLIGSLLSVLSFHSFEGWRALHMLHHRYTNSIGRDPACPRPGEWRATYLFTALYRMATFTRTRFYRLQTRRGADFARAWGKSQKGFRHEQMDYDIGTAWFRSGLRAPEFEARLPSTGYRQRRVGHRWPGCH